MSVVSEQPKGIKNYFWMRIFNITTDFTDYADKKTRTEERRIGKTRGWEIVNGSWEVPLKKYKEKGEFFEVDGLCDSELNYRGNTG